MKTIAQQLNITEFPYIIRNEKGNKIYHENSDGYWYKQEYNSQGKEIYYENSKGFWEKREYDSHGNKIYHEDSDGYIFDNRPKPKPTIELTLEDIAKLAGVSVEQIKIKK